MAWTKAKTAVVAGVVVLVAAGTTTIAVQEIHRRNSSVEEQLRSKGKRWVRVPGKITPGAYVEDILVGRLGQPQGRGDIGKVVAMGSSPGGVPGAIVDFGRGYVVDINLDELSLVNIVAE